jgi:putative peptidoglycan lipid II flippase
MQQKDYRDTLIVVFGLGLAILTGFARQAAIARQLGASRGADIYLVAFALPEFVIIALPIILTPAFIPIFTKIRNFEGETLAWQFALRVAQALGLFLLVLTAAAAIGAPVYLTWMSPGFTLAEREKTLSALYPMLPGILLMGMATLASSISQNYRRFLRPALITAVYNLAFIATLFFLPIAQPILRASWGVTIGAATALLIFLPFIKGWTSIQAIQRARHAPQTDIREWASLTGPLALGYAVHHLILFVDRAMATALGAGSAAALNYADHLTLVVVQLSGLAVSTVLFPGLADLVASGDMTLARRSLASALILVWKIALPASAGLILLRTPLVRILLEYGAFDQQATALVSAPVIWYSIAVLADALCQPLWRAVYARREGWTVVAINGLQTGIRLGANLALTPWLGYIGLALSAAIGLTFQIAVLLWWARRLFGFGMTSSDWLEIMRAVLAASIALLASSILYNMANAAQPVLIVLACSICGTLIYVSTLYGSKSLRKLPYGT